MWTCIVLPVVIELLNGLWCCKCVHYQLITTRFICIRCWQHSYVSDIMPVSMCQTPTLVCHHITLYQMLWFGGCCFLLCGAYSMPAGLLTWQWLCFLFGIDQSRIACAYCRTPYAPQVGLTLHCSQCYWSIASQMLTLPVSSNLMPPSSWQS